MKSGRCGRPRLDDKIDRDLDDEVAPLGLAGPVQVLHGRPISELPGAVGGLLLEILQAVDDPDLRAERRWRWIVAAAAGQDAGGDTRTEGLAQDGHG